MDVTLDSFESKVIIPGRGTSLTLPHDGETDDKLTNFH